MICYFEINIILLLEFPTLFNYFLVKVLISLFYIRNIVCEIIDFHEKCFYLKNNDLLCIEK